MGNLNNTMEFQNDSLELQEMREQLALLNRKLEKEHILNEKLMRKAMGKRIKKYQRDNWIAAFVILVIAVPCFGLITWKAGTSIYFFIVTIIYLLSAIVFNFYTWRPIRQEDFLSGNLCEVSKHLVTIKKLYIRWRTFGIPFVILWLLWFVYELSESYNGTDESVKGLVRGILTGGIIGGIGGAIVGTIAYLKMKKDLNKTIKEIEDLTKE